MKILKNTITIVVLLLVVGLLSSCGKVETYGQAISNEKITSVGDILKNPSSFQGKFVTVKGTIDTECPTGCWFNLKDDTALIYVDLGAYAFAIPQKVGHTATVEGKIVIEENEVMLAGRGVKIQ